MAKTPKRANPPDATRASVSKVALNLKALQAKEKAREVSVDALFDAIDARFDAVEASAEENHKATDERLDALEALPPVVIPDDTVASISKELDKIEALVPDSDDETGKGIMASVDAIRAILADE